MKKYLKKYGWISIFLCVLTGGIFCFRGCQQEPSFLKNESSSKQSLQPISPSEDTRTHKDSIKTPSPPHKVITHIKAPIKYDRITPVLVNKIVPDEPVYVIAIANTIEHSNVVPEVNITQQTPDSLITVLSRKKIWGIPLPSLKLPHLKLPEITLPKRMDRGIVNYLFVPKNSWMGGISVSYSNHFNTDYDFLIVKDWSGSGNTIKFSPFAGYFFKNNMAAGARFTYKRTTVNIDELSIDLGDELNFSIKDIAYIDQSYYGTAFIRTYVGLGEDRRFGLFNEASITLGGGRGKFITGKEIDLKGTYQTSKELQIGMSPGLSVFIANEVAVEASVGVLGFTFKKIDQTTNQIYNGSRRTSNANFKINLFSINLGITAYL